MEQTKHTNHHSLKKKILLELKIYPNIMNENKLNTLISVDLASLITENIRVAPIVSSNQSKDTLV